MEKLKKLLIIFFLLVLTLPAIWSLFRPGFFQSDDGEWMIIRFSAFHQALRDGQFPIRWLGRLNHEYGYPVANFLYPGFMYLAEVPKILGFGFVDSIKIILGLSMVGSAIFTYLWLAKIFNKFPAFVGALFYLYTPYHLWDLYKRGSVGEVLALAVVPFIFWQIERRSLFWLTLGLGFLTLSHNTLAILFLPLTILYMILSIWSSPEKLRQVYRYTCILGMGLGLSAFFWIPAIFDLPTTKFSQTQVSDWQDYFVNFRLVGWGTMSVFFFALLPILKTKARLFHFSFPKNRSKNSLFFLLAGIGSIFLGLSQSGFLWQNLPVGFVQFPFRFLSLTVLSTAFLAAFVLASFTGLMRWVISLILTAALLLSVSPYTKPAEFFDKGEGFYATNEDTTTVKNEYMPKWVKEAPVSRPEKKIEVLKATALWKIENLFFNSSKITFQTQNYSEVLLQANVVYFPGWQVLVDGGPTKINPDNPQGLIQFNVPSGNHYVEVKFSRTPLRLFSELVSLVSLLILASLTLRCIRLNRGENG